VRNRSLFGQGLLVLFSASLMASIGAWASDKIAVGNVSSLTEVTRFGVGLSFFNVVFLSQDRIGVADTNHAAFWDLETQEPFLEFTGSQTGRVIGISPDRTLLALYAASGTLEIWTVDPFEKQINLCKIVRTDWPKAEFSPDQRLLAVTNRWNDIEIWDLDTEERLHNLTGHTSNMFSLAFSPDGQLLASGGGTSSRTDQGESFIGIWDVTTGEQVAKLPTADLGDNHDLTFTKDGTRLISAGNHRMLAWNTATWERVHDSGPAYPGSYGISLSPDGSLLAIATIDNRRLRIVRTDTLRPVRDIYVGAELVDVDFSLDGTKLAASCTDGTLRIWGRP
jgi:WD40 repeat protein